MNLSKIKKVLNHQVNQVLANPVLTAIVVFCVLAILVVILSLPFYRHTPYRFYEQILTEAHGMLFDIAVIGILLVWLNNTAEKRRRIRSYQDEIDDFRLWQSDEAAFRNVGNIKRLNRFKVYNIDLANCYLARTNLNYVSLSEANLNSANLKDAVLTEGNLENARLNQTNFENANLNQANCKKAYASGADFKGAFLIKTNFEQSFLIKTNFENAILMEANLQGCDLTGANFKNANLYKCDLRNSHGLTVEQLAESRTLYLAKIDEALTKQINTTHPQLLNK